MKYELARNVNRLIMVASMAFYLASGVATAASISTPPDGYNKYLTYIANGQYDVFSENPDVPACFQQFCDGIFFQTEIQQRTAAEIEALAAAAKEFFIWRFGIDVDDPANAGRVTFAPFYLDPRNKYRAYAISHKFVPSKGYEVRDGGFGITITDPNGYTLGGEFDGVQIPAATTLGFGEYNIAVTHRGHRVRTINISYRALLPLAPTTLGLVPFMCELHRGRLDDNNFGQQAVARQGIAQGLGSFFPLGDGTFKINIRNSLTFSDDFGGF